MITQGLARLGVTASTYVPVSEDGLIGFVPSLGVSFLAEFNRDPNSNRGSGTARTGVTLVFEGDAQLSAEAGYTVLGDFRSWTLSLTGSIPF